MGIRNWLRGGSPYALVALIFAAGAAAATAQDLEPRAYANTPIGLNFLLAGVIHTDGNVAFDAALPIKDPTLRTTTGVLGLAHTLDVAGQSGKLALVLPYTHLRGHALFLGDPVQRDVTDFGDPLLRFSANFYGAPSLSVKEFAGYRQDVIVGASLAVAVPLGQYDASRLINIGGHRWVSKVELGVSRAWGAWTLEVVPGATFFTDNHDFYGGRKRAQDPIYSVQSHLIHSFRSGAWVALDATWYHGGRTTIDGVRSNDLQTNTRLGATFVLPVDRYNSIRLHASTGASTRTGSDFDAYGIAWQYRWGGGF